VDSRSVLLCAVAVAVCVVALPAARDANTETFTVHADRGSWNANPMFMGCHSDSGYTHQPRGFYSQLIFGESFEKTLPQHGSGDPSFGNPWTAVGSGDSRTKVALDDTTSFFHGNYSLGLKAQKDIDHPLDTVFAGAVNRGIGNEGLSFEADKTYEGYFFAKAEKAVTFVVWLEVGKNTVAKATVPFDGGEWTKLNFEFTTSAGAKCMEASTLDQPRVNCTAGPNPSHICVECAGAFGISLQSPEDPLEAAEANIDYVFLQPGAWGRFAGLSVRRDGVETLKSIGVTAIRQGGSFTDPDFYFWKNWRGQPWARESLGAEWGAELISGWGPFEFIDMCNAAGIEPIMTTTAQTADCCKPSDMGDLVEYAWGDPYTTTWGKVRAADGHPEPYKVKYFELGNEQYNSEFAEQVAAMEERAAGLGMAKELFYMSPNNGAWLQPDEALKVEALGIKDHAVMDQHVGTGGAVEKAAATFAANPGLTMGSVNAEVNARTHQMPRALTEATDINDHLNCDPRNPATAWCSRIHFRTASFCMERSGDYDAFDQGITFFLPNQTWIQPPGYTHQMIHQTWQPNMLSVYGYRGNPDNRASAAVSAAGDSLTLRLVNTNVTALDFAVEIRGMQVADTATVTMLATPPGAVYSGNTPGDPTSIVPVTSTIKTTGSGDIRLTMPPLSFATVVLTRQD